MASTKTEKKGKEASESLLGEVALIDKLAPHMQSPEVHMYLNVVSKRYEDLTASLSGNEATLVIVAEMMYLLKTAIDNK